MQNQIDADKIKEMFERVKRAFINIVENIKNNKNLMFAAKVSQDKDIKKYMGMYKRVKSKRLKKKYSSKINARIEYIKINTK